MVQKLEYTVLDLIDSSFRNMKAQPLNLGGIGGVGGGVGAPPAGYIGWLPQTRVAYDYDELATLDTAPSGLNPPSGWSLLDNLNHIRYRLNILESGGSIVVFDDNDIVEYLDTEVIHFSGAGVVVNDLGDGEIQVVITATGSGGSGTPLTVQEADGSPIVTNVDKIIFSGAYVTDLGNGDVLVTFSGGGGSDGTYLRLDATNDPVTGPLRIQVDDTLSPDYAFEVLANETDLSAFYFESATDFGGRIIAHGNHTNLYLEQSFETTGTISNAMLDAGRVVWSSSADVLITAPFIHLHDFTFNDVVNSGGAIRHSLDNTSILWDVNPFGYQGRFNYFNAQRAVGASEKLLEIEVLGSDRFYVTGSGMAYDIHGHLTALEHIENGVVRRHLTENTVIASGYGAVLVDYLDLNSFNLTLAGDASVAVVNGTSSSEIDAHVADTTDPHGANMSVSGSIDVPQLEVPDTGINISKNSNANILSPRTGMVLVKGDLPSTAAFCDLVLFQAYGAATIVSSVVFGTPPGRTYSSIGGDLNLALDNTGSAGSYDIFLVNMAS